MNTSLLLSFFLASLLLGITPGPDIIFVLTQSAVHGARAGIATTLGLVTGLFVHTGIVALGVAAIFQTSPLAFTLLKCVGAAYLLWLAWLSFRAGACLASMDGGQAIMPSLGQLYRRGIVMNVTNPKVSLFFLAFLPQFCRPEAGNMAVQVVVLGALFMLATLLVFFSVAFLGGRIAPVFNRSRTGQVLVNRLAGLVFVALAGALLFTG